MSSADKAAASLSDARINGPHPCAIPPHLVRFLKPPPSWPACGTWGCSRESARPGGATRLYDGSKRVLRKYSSATAGVGQDLAVPGKEFSHLKFWALHPPPHTT